MGYLTEKKKNGGEWLLYEQGKHNAMHDDLVLDPSCSDVYPRIIRCELSRENLETERSRSGNLQESDNR